MKEALLREHARRFATGAAALELLRDAVRILDGVGIEAMPLKGVLLHHLFGMDPIAREIQDVDIAVRSHDYYRARCSLVRAGYVVLREEPGSYESALQSARFPLCIDLHRAFAAARRFGLSPDAMFIRGRQDVETFGVRVVLPDYYDIYAHLLAHSALDFVATGAWHRPDDLRQVAAAALLDPEVCARRIDEHGLGRFLRLAAAAGVDRPFGQLVCNRLRRDRLGAALARAAERLCREADSPRVLRRIAGVLLNPTLGEITAAVVEAAVSRIS